MIISPWEIYLVMQLDSINGFFFTIALVLSIICCCALFAGALATGAGLSKYTDDTEKRNWEVTKKITKKLGTIAFIAGLLCAVLPSSKTAAAMIVIPAVLNNQSVQVEAKELYALAKQGFAEMVKAEVVPAKPAEEATEE